MTEIKRIQVQPRMARPPGLLWEGRPAWRSAAVYLFRIRWIAAYFIALGLLTAANAMIARVPAAVALPRLAGLCLSAIFTCGLVVLAARLTERTTRYTLTDTHLVMRYGLALPATLTVPLTLIDHVALRLQPDHSGDIAVRLGGPQPVSYVKLFPHARPWRLARPQPMLRSVPQAAVAGGILARAVAAAAREARAES